MSPPAHTPAPVPPPIPDYELLRPIGRGSYGEVWLARGVTGVLRAIKIVWRDRFADAEPFEREFHGVKEFIAIPADGRTQLALLHVGRNDEAHFFYTVMELADDAERGRDIDPAAYVPLTLAEARARRGRLAAATSIRYGVELARALAALHARGVVHRDIKPSNVILVGGIPKLADVGLVSRADTALSFVGTHGFVPPEGPGTPAADVYALGKLLYEISTGLDQRQFPQLPANLRELADRHTLLGLNRIVLRACDPAPARRYRDATPMLADLLALQAAPARKPRASFFAATAAIAAVAVGLVLAWPYLRTRLRNDEGDWTRLTGPLPNPNTLGVAPAERAVAVLPLAYLGTDPSKAFFAEGMHAEIIATLERIPELRVSARESVRPYRDASDSLPSIGRRLGVGNVMTGTVRCSDEAIRIQLELRRAADESLLWAQSYDRQYRDVISVQTAVAEEVARVLQARAIGGGAEVAKFLTSNPEAHERFLRATVLVESTHGPERKQAIEQAIALFDEALRLDPQFMPAASALSQAHVILITNYERDPARMAEHAAAGRHWAKRASELMPGGAGDAALAYYYTNVEHDNVRGCLFAVKAVRAWPNAAGPCGLLANALTGLGRPELALPWNRRAMTLNPSGIVVRTNNLMHLAAARQKDDWRVALADYRAVAEGDQLRTWAIPLSRFRLFGALPSEEDRQALSVRYQVEFLWYGRRFAEALERADTELRSGEVAELDRFELQDLRIEILRRLGRTAEADEAARDNLAFAERLHATAQVDPTQNDERMARALAGAGRFEEAINAAHRSIDALPVPAQQTRRWLREGRLALILTAAHRPREASELLAALLRVPSWLTVPMLRVDPRWDNLRSEKAFQSLLSDPANDRPFGQPLNRTAPAASSPRP